MSLLWLLLPESRAAYTGGGALAYFALRSTSILSVSWVGCLFVVVVVGKL